MSGTLQDLLQRNSSEEHFHSGACPVRPGGPKGRENEQLPEEGGRKSGNRNKK